MSRWSTNFLLRFQLVATVIHTLWKHRAGVRVAWVSLVKTAVINPPFLVMFLVKLSSSPHRKAKNRIFWRSYQILPDPSCLFIIWWPGSGFTKDWWPERFHRVSETRPPCGPRSWDPRGSDVAVALPWTHRLTSSQRVVAAKGTVTSQRWGNMGKLWTFWEALCKLAIDLLVRNWATLVGSSREVPGIFSDLQMSWIDEAFAKVPKILSTFTGVDHIASYSSNMQQLNSSQLLCSKCESPTSLGTPGLFSSDFRLQNPLLFPLISPSPSRDIWRCRDSLHPSSGMQTLGDCQENGENGLCIYRFTPEIQPMTDHMTDPAGAGIYANMTGVNLDGIHGTPFFSQHRKRIRHGQWGEEFLHHHDFIMREDQFGSLHWVWVAPCDGFFLRASAPEKYQGYSQYSLKISLVISWNGGCLKGLTVITAGWIPDVWCTL